MNVGGYVPSDMKDEFRISKSKCSDGGQLPSVNRAGTGPANVGRETARQTAGSSNASREMIEDVGGPMPSVAEYLRPTASAYIAAAFVSDVPGPDLHITAFDKMRQSGKMSLDGIGSTGAYNKMLKSLAGNPMHPVRSLVVLSSDLVKNRIPLLVPALVQT